MNLKITIILQTVPCILEPREIAHGDKGDIEICHSYEDIEKAIKKSRKLQYLSLIFMPLLIVSIAKCARQLKKK